MHRIARSINGISRITNNFLVAVFLQEKQYLQIVSFCVFSLPSPSAKAVTGISPSNMTQQSKRLKIRFLILFPPFRRPSTA